MFAKLRWTVALLLISPIVALAQSPATVVVEAPADARLYFDGQPTRHMGALRTFVNPTLPSDKQYTYTLKVEWMRDGQTMTHEETVHVQSGQTTRIMLARLGQHAMMMSPDRLVYALDYDAQRNAVVVLRRQADGSLQAVGGSSFATGGKGLTDGDIDEQGAVRRSLHFGRAACPVRRATGRVPGLRGLSPELPRDHPAQQGRPE
ncbi:MAG: TIGR03000 domain-containing protein [Planctomycetia bacterium]|nr:TIGR03000 domain-containing protein [Planctomycetia bacterium]